MMNRELNKRLQKVWDEQDKVADKKVSRVRKAVRETKEKEEEHRAKKYLDEIKNALGLK